MDLLVQVFTVKHGGFVLHEVAYAKGHYVGGTLTMLDGNLPI